jgi:excisionase family DNA binding protein
MQILVHTIAEACAVARVGKTAIYRAINEGKLPARKQGRRTLVLEADLRRYIEALPTLVPTDKSKTPDTKKDKRNDAVDQQKAQQAGRAGQPAGGRP